MVGHRTGMICARNLGSFFSRRRGSGSLMVWAVFCCNGQVSLRFTSGRKPSQDYTKTLEDNLLPIAELLDGSQWEFQQDNALIDTANSTQVWFNSQNIKVLNWTTCSPDLNTIENLWASCVAKFTAMVDNTLL
ncbi:hypothetical protein AVEN_136769-1 [Araneus ventricosus]|uniref:Tc1-like transposase DDE domain-containing protein n=1 Tax=Araneus ventricosus TaxID=182803 RepID=A0A4Y2UQU9_ARAVE|nr:hypothetical protein AVEN_226192-1 [Araneus ventricosus]GBO13927.1 hypothetical protein AVEN_136769-1 [Araneus ventricosus]